MLLVSLQCSVLYGYRYLSKLVQIDQNKYIFLLVQTIFSWIWFLWGNKKKVLIEMYANSLMDWIGLSKPILNDLQIYKLISASVGWHNLVLIRNKWCILMYFDHKLSNYVLVGLNGNLRMIVNLRQ